MIRCNPNEFCAHVKVTDPLDFWAVPENRDVFVTNGKYATSFSVLTGDNPDDALMNPKNAMFFVRDEIARREREVARERKRIKPETYRRLVRSHLF